MILKSLLIYFSCFGLSVFFAYLYQHQWKKNGYKNFTFPKKLFWYFLITAPPIVVSSIRYDVGTDFFNYINIYNIINSFSFEKAWEFYGNEPLYFLLNKFAYLLFKNEWGVFFLSSLIIHLFLLKGIDYFKREISIPLALFIFYMYLFSFSLNGIRQAIAMSIVLYAIKYIYERKSIKYILFIIVASLFHNTAIICLTFYLLVFKTKGLLSMTRNMLYYVLILLTPIILIFLLKFFVRFPIFSEYAKYFSNINISFNFGFLLGIVPILLPVFFYKKGILKINSNFESIINLSLLVVPFHYIGYYVNWGTRMALYIHILYLILIPLVIRVIKNKNEKMLICCYYVFYFFIHYFINIVFKTYHDVYPYKSFLF